MRLDDSNKIPINYIFSYRLAAICKISNIINSHNIVNISELRNKCGSEFAKIIILLCIIELYRITIYTWTLDISPSLSYFEIFIL